MDELDGDTAGAEEIVMNEPVDDAAGAEPIEEIAMDEPAGEAAGAEPIEEITMDEPVGDTAGEEPERIAMEELADNASGTESIEELVMDEPAFGTTVAREEPMDVVDEDTRLPVAKPDEEITMDSDDYYRQEKQHDVMTTEATSVSERGDWHSETSADKTAIASENSKEGQIVAVMGETKDVSFKDVISAGFDDDQSRIDATPPCDVAYTTAKKTKIVISTSDRKPLAEPAVPGQPDTEVEAIAVSRLDGKQSEAKPLMAEAKEEKAAPAPVIKRKTTIRYYQQMNPGKSFPLAVILSKDAVAPVKLDNVKQQQGKKTVSVVKDNPRVKITPCLSGCLVTPASMVLDVTPESATADFWVTPIIEGNINGWIDIAYQEETIEKIPLQVCSVKQTWAKVAAAAAVLSPVISYALEGFKLDPRNLEGLPRLLAIIDGKIGLLLLGILAIIPFLAAGIFFYRRSQPKEAEILEKFLSTEKSKN